METSVITIRNIRKLGFKLVDDIITADENTNCGEGGVLWIISGSMSSPGFIVRGKGDALAVKSASHGAGRVLSRTRAKQSLSRDEMRKQLKKAGVTVMGSDLDEAPQVYKNIHQVMACQTDLVEIVGTFTPKVVRMCG